MHLDQHAPPINITVGITDLPDTSAQEATAGLRPWPDVVAQTLNPPEYPSKGACSMRMLLLLGSVRSGKGSLRHAGNVLAVHGVIGDYDGGRVSIDEAAAMLRAARVECVICTTASHRPEAPRWRVYAPAQIPLAPDDHREQVGFVNAVLGGILAPESFTLCQSYYFGCVTGVPYVARHVSGLPVDVAALFSSLEPVYPRGAQAPAPREVASFDRQATRDSATLETIADLESAVLGMSPTRADDRDKWLAVMLALASLKGGAFEDDARRLAHLFSARCPEKYKAAEIDAWFDKNDATGYTHKTIFALAQEDGWVNPRKGKPVARVELLPAEAPELERTEAGYARATRSNLLAALSAAKVLGIRIVKDEFRGGLMFDPKGGDELRPMTDAFEYELGCLLEQRLQFGDIPKERLRDAIAYVAERNAIDSAQLWLQGLEHDGTPRVKMFAVNYLGADDTPYARAMSSYVWSGLASRVMHPGCQLDMAAILAGLQGVGKSRSVRAISPAPDFFAEMDLAENDDDAARRMRGKLVIEFSEMRGARRRELEATKAFITRTHDQWVPKYKEHAVEYARRCMFFGTSNSDELLVDETGNRRWLPITVGRCDPDAIARDCAQLWAEGRDIARQWGVLWQDAQRLAADEHGKFVERDPWEEQIAAWLETSTPTFDDQPEVPNGSGFITVRRVLESAIGLLPREINKNAENRAGTALRALGYVKARRRINGRLARGFERAVPT